MNVNKRMIPSYELEANKLELEFLIDGLERRLAHLTADGASAPPDGSLTLRMLGDLRAARDAGAG